MKRILLLSALMMSLVINAATDYDVRDFGALGDGKTLDHTAINRAIDTCVAHFGRCHYPGRTGIHESI